LAWSQASTTAVGTLTVERGSNAKPRAVELEPPVTAGALETRRLFAYGEGSSAEFDG
jgi:hypothetical protein